MSNSYQILQFEREKVQTEGGESEKKWEAPQASTLIIWISLPAKYLSSEK